MTAPTPTGAVDGPTTQASIRFSEPMVALAGSDADHVDYLTVTPAVDVAFHWPDTNVLVVTPRAGRFPLRPQVSRRMPMAEVAGIVAPGGSGRLALKAEGTCPVSARRGSASPSRRAR